MIMLNNDGLETLLFENIYTPEKFTADIERVVHFDGLTYMEAIVDFCEEQDIPIEDAPKLITPQLKRNIEQEANELRLLKVHDESTKII